MPETDAGPYAELQGALWLDRSSGGGDLKFRNNGVWENVFGDKFKIICEILNDTEPKNPVLGQLWLDNGILKYFSGVDWIPVKSVNVDTNINLSVFEQFLLIAPVEAAGKKVINPEHEIINGFIEEVFQTTTPKQQYILEKGECSTQGLGVEVYINGNRLPNTYYQIINSIVIEIIETLGESPEGENNIITINYQNNRQELSIDETHCQFLVPSVDLDRVFINGYHDIPTSFYEDCKVDIPNDVIFSTISNIALEYPTDDMVNKSIAAVHVNPKKLTNITKKVIKINNNGFIPVTEWNTEFYAIKDGVCKLITKKPIAEYTATSNGIILSQDIVNKYDFIYAITYEFDSASTGIGELYKNVVILNNSSSIYIGELEDPNTISVFTQGLYLDPEGNYEYKNGYINIKLPGMLDIGIIVWPKKETGTLIDFNEDGKGVITSNLTFEKPLIMVYGFTLTQDFKVLNKSDYTIEQDPNGTIKFILSEKFNQPGLKYAIVETITYDLYGDIDEDMFIDSGTIIEDIDGELYIDLIDTIKDDGTETYITDLETLENVILFTNGLLIAKNDVEIDTANGRIYIKNHNFEAGMDYTLLRDDKGRYIHSNKVSFNTLPLPHKSDATLVYIENQLLTDANDLYSTYLPTKAYNGEVKLIINDNIETWYIYNNGWQKDSAGNNVLRLSNGAKVTIPIDDLLSFQNRTYEFDFRVHNATNYSKLINITTVYQKNEDGSLKLDENGKPIPEVETDASGNEHEVVEKTASSGEGAFLTFYDKAAKQGYMLGTQEAFFAYSEHDIANVRYADDTRVKVSFVVRYNEKREEGANGIIPIEKYVYIYVDGVLSAAYPITPGQTGMSCKASAIEINSEYCDVDIYNIRIYETALDYNGIVTNWIGDSSTLQIMSEKYVRNNLTIGSGINTTLDYEKVKQSGLIPVMVLTTYGEGIGGVDDLLPYKKGDKRMCGVRYYDPQNLSKNFHAYNCELDVQGTSSQGYPRRNYKLKTKQYDKNKDFYFEKWDGIEENKNVWVSYAEGASDADKAKQLKKWDLGHGVKETTFCLKADYMESSSSHNTGLANLVADIQMQHQNSDVYDFRHPLTRRHDINSRTTIYGYPILLFHEQKVVENGVESNKIEFIGKYNFNIDKGATDSFGFTNGTVNEASEAIYPEYIECKVNDKKAMYPVVLATDENGELKRDPDNNGLYYIHPEGNVEKPLKDEDDKPITGYGRGSYEQVSECWEFTQNQPGPGKFQEQNGGFYATADGTEATKIIAADHFEMRYHYADFDDPYEGNDVVTANGLFKRYTKNLAKMVDWVASTDVSANAEQLGNLGKALPAPKRYRTRDTEYVEGHVYYDSVEATEPYDVVKTDTVEFATSDIKVNIGTFLSNLTALEGAELGDYSISCEFEEVRNVVVDEKTGEETVAITYNILAWTLDYLKKTGNVLEAIRLSDNIGNLTDWGLTLPSDWGTSTITFTYANKATRWNANLYQEYTHDTKEYRLAKFKDEFSLHFNLAHTLFYFVMTELLLLYDSRQKNMMMASWGPEIAGGDYIWYPIFYDMDTQLGVNNSGQVYWDYDTDATPKDNPDASIFSGTGSVFWANLATCFEEEIKFAYRQLRGSSLVLSEYTLQKAYNTNQSDKWSEQMKNLDAFFKYIAPTDKDYGGFINTDGEVTTSSTYIYCLQGDRKLNRNALFRNRLNYKDSEWLGGNYNPTKMSNAITMRYNLNEINKTSDGLMSQVDGVVFNGDPDYKITPFLTQYVSVAYDQIAADPVRFDIANDSIEYAHVHAPETIRNRAEAGVMLTQQLAYVYGPQFISDLGDLSDKYLNVFQAEGAIRLRNLQIGNDKPGYKNIQFTDLDRTENGANSAQAKTLLQYIDFSNLSEFAGTYNVSGCLKLKSFKALNTKLTEVVFPQGNLLEKIYFPATIEHLELQAPLSLNGIITDLNRVSWVQDDGTWVHNNDNGLYIENLTNKLNSQVSEANGSYTKIKYYQMDNTNMGYDTYKMLKYLYDLKQIVREAQVRIYKAEQNGATLSSEEMATKNWAQKTNAELRIQVLNAAWTPYEVVELGSLYDSGTTYYKLNDDLTYSVINTTANTWEQDLKDYEIFVKVRDNSPATDLTMFDTFINDFVTKECTTTSQTYPYIYRAINNDPLGETNKVLPIITGDLHIHNDANNALKEYDLFTKYGATGRFNELKITAEHVAPCYRAKFIEYGTEGETIVHGWQRSELAASIACPSDMDKPERLYYDFLGWAYDSPTLKANHSIGTEEDVVLLPNGHDWVIGAGQTALTVPGETVVLVAVFRLTKWKVSFIDGDGNPLLNSANNNIPYWEFSTQERIVPPVLIPGKDESDLTLYDCYRFIGYSASPDDKENLINFNKAIYPTRDISYYAQFETVNVYENPIPLEQLHYNIVDNGVAIALKANYDRRGKLCVPKTLLINNIEYNVVAILGDALVDSLGVSQKSGFAGTEKITHIFIQGTQDNSSHITFFGQGAFRSASNLVHLDIPSSLKQLNDYALAYTSMLKLSNLKNITWFGFEALRGSSGEKSAVTADDTLYISGDVEYMSTGSFRFIKYWRVQIGDAKKPLTQLPVVPNNIQYLFDFNYDMKDYNKITLTIFTTLDEEEVETFFRTCSGSSASLIFDIQTV